MRTLDFSRGTAAVVLALAIGASACSSDDEKDDTSAEVCLTRVTGATSPAAGVLTLKGSFYSDESVGVRDATTNALLGVGTPSNNRNAFSFTGIPSGTHKFIVTVSCDSGNDTLEAETYTVL